MADKDGFIILKGFLFDYIGKAEHITIPDGVRFIGSEALARRDYLKTVVCPDSVTKILSRAFYCCENMTSITIPNKLAEIKENAFLGCGMKMVFCAPEGSEIEKYVEENSIKFKAI